MERIIGFLSLAALLITGCSLRDLEMGHIKNDLPVFEASFENSTDKTTKTYIDNKNMVRWTKDDRVSIFVANTSNCEYKFDGKTGANNGSFSALSNPVEITSDILSANYAVYPYSESNKMNANGELSIVLPSVQKYAESSFGLGSNTMVAVTEDKSDTFLQFKNLCGYIVVGLYGEGTVRSLSLQGNDGEKIAGTAAVVARYGKSPEITMSSTATEIITVDCGENGIVLGSSENYATEFWFCVPPVTFENGFSVTITDIDGATVVKDVQSSMTVNRNVINRMSNLEIFTQSSKTVNPDYVHIDWNNCQVESVDAANNIYTINTNGKSISLPSGSVIIIDNQVKVVVNTSYDGDLCTIKAEDGDVSNIFHDVEFTLATSPDAVVQTKAAGHRIYYPSEIIYCNSMGEYITVKTAQTKSDSFTYKLWTWGEDFSGTTITSGDNWRLYWGSAYYKLDIDAVISLSFGGLNLVEFGNSAIQQYKSKAMWVDASVVGTFDADALMKFEASDSFNYQEEDEMFIQNVFKPVTMIFPVNGINVPLTLSSDMFRGASLEGSGNIEASAGAGIQAIGKIGLRWSQSTNLLEPYNSFDQTITLHMPNTNGQGSLEGKCWVYPRVKLLLYGVLGPSFDFKPYQKVTLSGGYNLTMGSSPEDFMAWDLETCCGVDAAVGLNLSYMNHEIENLSSPDINIYDKKLYSTPYSISNVSTVDFSQCTTGTATFVVKDWDNLSESAVKTPFPQVVRFESEGTLSKEYAFCSNGQVSVDWTPNDENDKLYARLYSTNGEVLDESVVTADSVDYSHEAIDMGLSVKWASCNVGASKPEEYGGYYAWGETEERTDYTQNSYIYYNYGWENIGSDISGTKYDIAHVRWGGNWRMPTMDEVKELIMNCSYEWTSVNGVEGELFVSNLNGNSIFLPAAGYKDGKSVCDKTYHGEYWTSILDPPGDAFEFDFRKGGTPTWAYSWYRRYGLVVRPVCDYK